MTGIRLTRTNPISSWHCAVAMTANVERAANPKGSRALDGKLRCGSP